MSKEKYSALILGANGLIGFSLLQELLNEDQYTVVYAVSRKDLGVTNSKLVNIIADFDTIDFEIKDLKVDHLYCCLGSTKSKTPNAKEYYQIDHDYPLKVAKILKANGLSMLSLVSSIGANKSSNNFYLKLKGQIEQEIIALQLESTQIFRPSLLVGERKEKRLLERFTQKISPLLDVLFVGPLKKYKSIKAITVAKAMHNLGLQIPSGVNIYESEDIKIEA